jgi:hypothetical protein
MFIFTAASARTLYWLLIITWGNHLTGTVIVSVEYNEQRIKIYQQSIVLFVIIKCGKVDMLINEYKKFHFIVYHEISRVSITKIYLMRREYYTIW